MVLRAHYLNPDLVNGSSSHHPQAILLPNNLQFPYISIIINSKLSFLLAFGSQIRIGTILNNSKTMSLTIFEAHGACATIASGDFPISYNGYGPTIMPRTQQQQDGWIYFPITAAARLDDKPQAIRRIERPGRTHGLILLQYGAAGILKQFKSLRQRRLMGTIPIRN
jgi:hypothetical protein